MCKPANPLTVVSNTSSDASATPRVVNPDCQRCKGCKLADQPGGCAALKKKPRLRTDEQNKDN